MATAPRQQWTVEAYLEFERSSEVRHEYLDGDIVAMVGASEAHNLISTSIVFSLYGQLRSRPCRVYSSDMRVKVNATGLYTYPDISVVCESPQFEANDTLLNPLLIIEILSPSTERYDRGKKFLHYRALDSLQEYILIAQDSPHIERYARQDSGQWLLTDITGLDSMLDLPSIGCTLRLADVYEKVDFSEGTAE